MTKAVIKRLFPKKQWCILQEQGNGIIAYWTGSVVWDVNDKSNAYLGTKRELEIILNKKLYQQKIRGAKVVKF